MTTQTQVVHRVAVKPYRPYDYLYDTLHAVSGARDHARAAFHAQTGADRIKSLPIFNQMFSEVSRFPRNEVILDRHDPIPAHVSRRWPGHVEKARAALQQLQSTIDSGTSTQTQTTGADVTGKYRWKFARRPIIPFVQGVPPNIVLAAARPDQPSLQALSHAQGSSGVGGKAGVAEEQISLSGGVPVRTVGVQTDMRESEAQTDPYTPEYVIRPGEQPELLTLTRLVWGRGLPAGLAEVEMIDRARMKRAWEAQLPPLDASQPELLDKRRRMMEEMEREEWAFREREIEKLQEARLAVLVALLKKREASHEELNQKRLERMWARLNDAKEAKFRKIRGEHLKSLRKLIRVRNAVMLRAPGGNLGGGDALENLTDYDSRRGLKRDIVRDYNKGDSQTFAPLTRLGVFPDRWADQYVVKNKYLSTYSGLLELEGSLPDFILQPRISAPRAKTVTREGFVKRKYREEKVLVEIHDLLKSKKELIEEEKPLRYLQVVEKPAPRPPTPTVQMPDFAEQEQQLAIIFLQQVIRGRAIQNMMLEGKEKRIELIRELRSTHALQGPGLAVKANEAATIATLQRQRVLNEEREHVLDELLESEEGETLAAMLDFLSKELVRLEEERRIHAFAILAERRRRVREAEEAGQRQIEERRRRQHDEIFKQVTSATQASVDTFLEDVIMRSMERASDIQARDEIHRLADSINEAAARIESERTHLETEEIVAELVHQFLIPEVQKQFVRERVKQAQRKFLLAAHREIFGATEGTMPTTTTLQTDRSEEPPAAPEEIQVNEEGSRSASVASVRSMASQTMEAASPRSTDEGVNPEGVTGFEAVYGLPGVAALLQQVDNEPSNVSRPITAEAQDLLQGRARSNNGSVAGSARQELASGSASPASVATERDQSAPGGGSNKGSAAGSKRASPSVRSPKGSQPASGAASPH